MSNKAHESESSGHTPSISKTSYKDSLRKLQVELVKLQRHFINCNDKILIILEGRDAAGKDGAINPASEPTRNPRCRPRQTLSDRDRTSR